MKLRALLLIGIWIAVLAAVFPLAAALDDVKSDEAATYLPADAQSTQAAEIEATLPGGVEGGFVVVYQRDSGITDADRTVAQRQAAELAARYETQAGPVATSQDGKALMFRFEVAESKGEPGAYLAELRGVVADRPAGLAAYVTGPGAMSGDFEGAFDGVDTQLLIVTVLVVTAILLLTYRSPFLWLVPLISVTVANFVAMGVVYLLVKTFGITVNDQSAAILTILVFGVGTDYALLLVARYREELHRESDVATAMLAAVRRAAPAIVASAATVTLGLLCLLAAGMNNIAGMGPVGAAGVVSTLAVMLTLFPALLVLLGRPVFWPRVPRVDTDHVVRVSIWERIGRGIAIRPAAAVAGALVLLGVFAAGLFGNTDSLSQAGRFVETPESVTGQQIAAQHFPEFGSGAPLTITAPIPIAAQVLSGVQADPGIAFATADRTGAGYTEIVAMPKDSPDTSGERATIERLRNTLPSGAAVGGPSAQLLDIETASTRDELVVIPLVLVVVTLILGLLLRSVVAPIMLVLTVVASFGAALGATVLASEHLFGFGGLDSGLVVLAFLFLVALGVDYNIFLMTRAREEAAQLGTRAGVLRSLAVTGGVITSAGIVLAATFAVLVTLPLVALAQLGFAVAFGVLLDTLLVRSVLVPALTLLLGERVWWPSSPAPQPLPEGDRELATVR